MQVYPDLPGAIVTHTWIFLIMQTVQRTTYSIVQLERQEMHSIPLFSNSHSTGQKECPRSTKTQCTSHSFTKCYFPFPFQKNNHRKLFSIPHSTSHSHSIPYSTGQFFSHSMHTNIPVFLKQNLLCIENPGLGCRAVKTTTTTTMTSSQQGGPQLFVGCPTLQTFHSKTRSIQLHCL